MREADKRKPPLAPSRSPAIKERKIRKRIRDDDIRGILDSVIAAVSNSSLNIDEDDNLIHDTNYNETDNHKEEDKQNEFLIGRDFNENIPDYKPDRDRVTESNHAAMKENNARMDSLWDNVLHSSNLSLNRTNNKYVQ